MAPRVRSGYSMTTVMPGSLGSGSGSGRRGSWSTTSSSCALGTEEPGLQAGTSGAPGGAGGAWSSGVMGPGSSGMVAATHERHGEWLWLAINGGN